MNEIVLFLASVPFYLLASPGYYKLFEKAGEKGWKAFIPFLNEYTTLKIIGKPAYNMIFTFIPIANLFVFVEDFFKVLKCFGITTKLNQLLALVFLPFYLPYLAFSDKTKYLGKHADLPKPEKKVSIVREWVDAIAFAVVAATFIRWLLIEAYTIPTSSMEKSLLVGDFLFVSKFHYGPRTPKTPLQVPLTHQKIWGTNLPSYSDAIQLPSYRLPGFTSIKRNDVVVFNYPAETEDYPTDLKTNYIKRCVGIAGDTLKVVDSQVYINGKPSENPEMMQFGYILVTKENINERVFQSNNITEYRPIDQGYFVQTTPATAAKLKNMPFIDQVIIAKNHEGEGSPEIFPSSSKVNWNADFFGPLWIPKKGATIQLTPQNLIIYETTITRYEGLENTSVVDGKLYIDGKPVDTYTFKQNYYFMMGDNRHNSADSRFWGFVPEDHVVGKALLIWMSYDNNSGAFRAIRWKRLFNLIE